MDDYVLLSRAALSDDLWRNKEHIRYKLICDE